MKILIAAPLFPPEIGGPAQYAFNLEREWQKLGHTVKTAKFSDVRNLPSGIRHVAYFFKVLAQLRGADFVLILDTFSVALPTILAAKLFGKKVIIRAGGDFLWEKYVERTGEAVRLSEFYIKPRKFSFKEKIIFKFTRSVLRWANLVVFNTDWLRQIWREPYKLDIVKTKIIENYFEFTKINDSKAKLFLAPARDIKLKNKLVLVRAFELAQKNNTTIKLDTTVSSPSELSRRVSESHAIIVPSISEVSPNLVLDGLALGKPFILTEDTGLPGVFLKCGILVDTRDEQKIARAIGDLGQSEVYEKLKENIKLLQANRSWSQIANEFIEL